MNQRPHEAYEIYSDDIRAAMLLANREAKRAFYPAVEPSHLLLGILKEPTGLAGHVLKRGRHDTRRTLRLLRRVNRFGGKVTITGKLPMSEATKAIIDQAVEYARQKSHASVGSGAILIAILEQSQTLRSAMDELDYNVEQLKEHLAIYLVRLMRCGPEESIQLDL